MEGVQPLFFQNPQVGFMETSIALEVDPGRGRCHHESAGPFWFAAGSMEGGDYKSSHPLPYSHSHLTGGTSVTWSYRAPQVCKRLRNGVTRLIAETRHQTFGCPRG